MAARTETRQSSRREHRLRPSNHGDHGPGGQAAGRDSAAGPIGVRYFALRNWKFVVGLGVVLAFFVLALVGPSLTDNTPFEFSGPTDRRPSSEYWFGTTSFGQDVFAQFVYGLRAAFLVGVLGGGIAWLLGAAVGFTAAIEEAGSTAS